MLFYTNKFYTHFFVRTTKLQTNKIKKHKNLFTKNSHNRFFLTPSHPKINLIRDINHPIFNLIIIFKKTKMALKHIHFHSHEILRSQIIGEGELEKWSTIIDLGIV
jgi:hypothetical protein